MSGQRLAEVIEVAIEVDVVFVDPAQPREAIRVERMQIQHGHILSVAVMQPVAVTQVIDLHRRAAKAFDTVDAAAHDQQIGRTGRA